LNGSSPPGPNNKGPIPHRWIIVGAMALAFVLCNMDKVGALRCACWGLLPKVLHGHVALCSASCCCIPRYAMLISG
jgi:hypothetical protein